MRETRTAGANALLRELSAQSQHLIDPALRQVDLKLSQVLHETCQPISDVYFPIDCIVSLVNMTESGQTSEICVVGHEGFVGTAIVLGTDRTPSRAIVQSAGTACVVPASVLKKAFDQDAELRVLLLRYLQALIIQMTQTVVCNRHHTIVQQLSRWLLLSLDRLPGRELRMTQELIANMLGVRREGVTDAASKLKSMGVIDYRRGHITVLDRPKLEQISCECYASVRSEIDRLYRRGKPR